MSRLRGSLFVSATLVAVAACSDSTGKVTAPASQSGSGVSFDAAPDHGNGPAFIVHQMPTQAQAKIGNLGGGGSGSGIYYHGGPVLLAGARVAAVYWSSTTIYTNGPTPGTFGAGSGDGSLVGTFLRTLGGSPYFNINSTYTDGAGHHIANAVAYTQYWANNTNAPSGTQSVTDASMLAMLASGFSSGALTYDPNTLYAIFTSGQVNLGGGFGTQYCAYHGYGTVTVGGVSKIVLYAAMPYDYAYPSACSSGFASPNADAGANAEVNTLAHETEETTTDMYLNAWYDRRGYENADKCAWTWGTTYHTANGGTANMKIAGVDYLIQRNWVNAGSGGCALSY